MSKNKLTKYFEPGLYLVLLAIALSIPLLISSQFETRDWPKITRGWMQLIPFLIVFLVNNFLLAPKLLLKGKYGQYIISCLLLLSVVMFADNRLMSKERMADEEMLRRHRLENSGRKMPDRPGFYPEEGRSHPPRFPHETPPDMPGRGRFHPPFINFGAIVIYFLLIGFNSGVKIFVRWNEEQKQRIEKEKQHLTTELAYLKHQISPHFFMNTLNNIHALVDIDTERAKEAVIKLSRLMRYMLYEPESEKTSLKKEIEFLESYIELMSLRYDRKTLKVKLKYPEKTERIMVPSFLFISLIENAFKYGIHLKKQSLIEILFGIDDNVLTLTVRNSKFSNQKTGLDENSGIGLENVKKRLQLIYKEHYTFSISDKEDCFEVTLSIPAT